MKQSMLIRFTAILTLVALSGCGSSGTMGPGSGSSPEQAAVATVLSDTPELIDDGQLESADVGMVNAGPARDGAVAAIRPYRFWRNIDSVERRFEYAFTDSDSTGRPTVAVVTVHKVLRGSFNIVAGPPAKTPKRSIRRATWFASRSSITGCGACVSCASRVPTASAAVSAACGRWQPPPE